MSAVYCRTRPDDIACVSSHSLPRKGRAVKLTQAAVATLKLPKGKSETITFDDDLPGFGLRMRAGGSCTWIYQYKLGSQHRRVTLGNAAALTVTQARKTATELHAHVRLGKDPAGEKIEGRVRATETMGAIVQTYLAHQRQRVRPRSYAGTERHLLTYSKPLLILPLVESTVARSPLDCL